MLREELIHELVRSIGGQGGATMSYATLRHVTAQLDRGANEWTLDVTGEVRLRRVGDTLTADGATRRANAEDGAARRAGAPPRALATRSISLGSATLDVPTEWQLTAGRGAPPPAAYTVNDGTAAADEKASAGGAPAGVTPASLVRLYNVPAGAALELRTWREGDRFHPAWRASPTAVASFLRGQGMPLDQRRFVPLLAKQGSTEVLALFASGSQGGEVCHVASGFGEGDEHEALWVALDTSGPRPGGRQSKSSRV